MLDADETKFVQFLVKEAVVGAVSGGGGMPRDRVGAISPAKIFRGLDQTGDGVVDLDEYMAAISLRVDSWGWGEVDDAVRSWRLCCFWGSAGGIL